MNVTTAWAVVASVALAWGAAGCSADDPALPGDAGVGAGGDAGAGTRDAVDAAPLQPIWTPDSRWLQVWCSLGTGRIARWEGTRYQLTPAQLALAEGLRARLGGEDRVCYLDGASCVVEVTEDGGQRITVRAPLDIDCDDSHRLISRATFQPFFEALACWDPPRQQAAPLRASPVCDHGLYATGPGDAWIQVSEAGRHRLDLAFCTVEGVAEPVRLQLLDAAGTTVLARGQVPAPGPRRLCQSLEHDFAAPGVYRVREEVLVPDYTMVAGMTLRFQRVTEQ